MTAPRPPAWPRILPFGLFIVLLLAEPYLSSVLEPVMDPRWLYGVRSAVVAVAVLLLWKRYSELRPERPAPASAWLLGAAAGVVVFGLWITLDFAPLVMGEPETPFDPTVDGRTHLGFAVTRLAGAALVVPIVEELFWRSFLMRWLEKPEFLDVSPGDIGWKPLVMTSVVFALEHRLWLAGLLAGLIYGELYRWTGSLWVTVFAHALTNALLGLYVLGTGGWGFW